jgi:perosamine synthetase
MQGQFQHIIDFIRGLYKEDKGFIPLHAPHFGGNEKRYLEECIDTTFVSSVGKFVDKFEEEMARYTGATKAVVCVNGTNALHLALMLLGVKEDTEVITQPLTFIATANAISYCGAKPVFIDVDKDTLGLSPKALLEFIENETQEDRQGRRINKTTKRIVSACVPMHTFGHPCRIDEIAEICIAYNIPLIEDAAESLGSFYKGQHTGTFGQVGILSFNGNKILTTGGGGMLLFNDEKLAARAKHITTQAKKPHAWAFEHDEIGYNYRMPNLNAALGLAQLEQLSLFLKSKRETAEKYKEFFKNTKYQFLAEPEKANSNYWLNAVVLKDSNERDLFLEETNKQGVMTRPIWALMNKLPMFKDAQVLNIENSQFLEERLVNIPSSVRI